MKLVDVEMNVLVGDLSSRARMRLMAVMQESDSVAEQRRALIHAQHLRFDV